MRSGFHMPKDQILSDEKFEALRQQFKKCVLNGTSTELFMPVTTKPNSAISYLYPQRYYATAETDAYMAELAWRVDCDRRDRAMDEYIERAQAKREYDGLMADMPEAEAE